MEVNIPCFRPCFYHLLHKIKLILLEKNEVLNANDEFFNANAGWEQEQDHGVF